jgi:hypothetical protein
MPNFNLDGLVTVTVHNIISSGAGFGVVVGSGAGCIIPSRVLHAADLGIGDLVRCKLINNPEEQYRHRTPFMVAYVDPNATADLRIAMYGGTPMEHEPAPSQLCLPLEPLVEPDLDLQDLLEDEPVEPEPEPLTIFTVRDMVSSATQAGGLWTVRQLRDALWPDDDFGSDDPRYKLLNNAIRDLHGNGDIAVFARRNTADGNLTRTQYTKFPDRVRFVYDEETA